jgi:signal transduction histidine kinase
MKYFILIIIQFITFSTYCTNQNLDGPDSDSNIHNINGNWEINYQNIDKIIEKGDKYSKSFPDSSFIYYEISLRLAQENNDIRNEARIYSKIGGVKYLIGEYDSSLENFVIALNKWRTEKNKQGIATGLNNIALIYNILDNYKEALDYHKNSTFLCKEIEDSSLLALNYFNMSLVYLNMHEYDSAIIYANHCLKINSDIKNTNELLKLNSLKGNIYFEKEEYQKARKLFLNVIGDKTHNNKWELSYALAGMSAVEQKTGNYKSSINYGIQGLTIAKEIKAGWDIQNISKILSDSYALSGDYENAYKLYKNYKLYSDSLFTNNKEKKINYLNLKQKDFEYITLSHKNEVQYDQIQKRENQILLATLIALFVAILAIIFFRNSYVNSKLNHQLRIKNFEIGKKNKELIKLNATKDTFFKIIGHDLKNPLCTVVSFTDMLQNNFHSFTDAEKLEYISLSKTSAANSIELLDNLLEWTKSQSGIYNINPVNTSFKKLVTNITDKHKNSFAEKNLNLIIDINESISGILDINLTSVVIRNLITNAIKFTNNNGTITVKAEIINSKVVISVIDNGIGMNSEKISGLFNIENNRSTSGTNQEKGMGIGLILCKELMEKQNGIIWAKSIPGKGSEFSIKI